MKENKVYTLTCTWASSYGAVLQAYALASKLNEIGYEARIINYQPRYAQPTKSTGILRPLYLLKDALFNRGYMQFLYDSRLITEDIYRSVDDLSQANLSALAFVVGSDQVWNSTKYFNGRDNAMFLSHAKGRTKRISYAASLAMQEIPKDQVDRYKSMLDRFTAVSVREQSGADVLTKIGVKDVKAVIDPVYLVSMNNWKKLANRSTKDFSKEKYLLVICLEERTAVYEYARKKADLLGVKLYSFRGGLKGLGKRAGLDRDFWNLSVYDYLNIVKNAEAVVADSFHAMSFSLIFNRDIDIIPRNDGGNSRMIDLLTQLEIPERVVHSDEVILERIDFEKVKALIELKSGLAVRFLEDAISGDVAR